MKHLSLILAVAMQAAYASTAAIPLTHDQNTWYGEITVGTPANTFTVAFDTASADIILPGRNCGLSCQGHKRYDPNSSSTANDLGKPFEMTISDGSTASGEQYDDTVSIGGLIATQQTLGVAKEYPSGLSVDSFLADGILGMAFRSISSVDASPVVDTLIAQGQLDAPVFSFKLAESGSELYLGGSNSALFSGDFAYTPVIGQGFWKANVEAITINGNPVLSNFDADIDTLSTTITLSREDAYTFYQVAGGTDASSAVGSGFYTLPCNSFPSVAFTFGGKSFLMSKETMNLGPVSAGSAECVSSIVGGDTGGKSAIIGTSFLQNVYTSFDIGNSRIGFATLA